MLKFVKGIFVTIMKDLASVYFPSDLHPRNSTNRSTAPVELQYETCTARELLKKDTQMEIARILGRL